MAIMPHCVVCGFDSGEPVAGDVAFADYFDGWQSPTHPNGSPLIGWSNNLGVTAPDGVGLFCARHLKQARRLRHLPASQAVERMRNKPGRWRFLFVRVAAIVERRPPRGPT